LKADYQVQELAQALEVSPSGFYAHQHKPQGRRACQDQRLVERIKPIFQASRGTYGSPRLHACLRRQGMRCGKNRIARLMREQQLVAHQKRRFVPPTTQSDHTEPVAPNRLGKMPAPVKPNQVWVADITYLPSAEGWVYLAVPWHEPIKSAGPHLDFCTIPIGESNMPVAPIGRSCGNIRSSPV
jgi:putative transposase